MEVNIKKMFTNTKIDVIATIIRNNINMLKIYIFEI